MGGVELTVRLSRSVLGDGMERSWQLEDELTRRLDAAELGPVDGHGVGLDLVEIFVDGSDRAALSDAIEASGLPPTQWLVIDADDDAPLPGISAAAGGHLRG